MLVLLDQDGVLADFERGFRDAWNTRMQSVYPALEPHQRHSFHIRNDYPAQYQNTVEAIYTTPGFFRDLPPIPGAIEAVKSLLDLGHDVRICTSPLNQYRYCVPEKYEWVEAHLGSDFVQRMIVTKDKTIIKGDVLVDDKPVITGTQQPHWQHILFDQPYNQHTPNPHRMTWHTWRTTLLKALSSAGHTPHRRLKPS